MKRRLARFILAMIMAGCGYETPTTTGETGKNTQDLIVTPQKPTQQGPSYDTKALLSSVAKQYQATQAMQSKTILYDAYNGQSVTSKSLCYFQKPNRYSILINEHTNPDIVGTKVVYTGGEEAKLKTKVFGIFVKTGLALSDSRICNLRGDTFIATGIVRMMRVLLDSQAQVKYLGQGTMAGTPVVMLEVVSTQSLRGITREVFYISEKTLIPVVREMYEGKNLVYKMQFINTVLNPKIQASTFSLD